MKEHEIRSKQIHICDVSVIIKYGKVKKNKVSHRLGGTSFLKAVSEQLNTSAKVTFELRPKEVEKK